MRKWLAYVRSWEMPSTGKWLILSALIGVVAGLGAIVFQWLVQVVQHLALVRVAGFPLSEAVAEYSPFPDVETTLSPWRLLLVLAAGGLVAGWLAWRIWASARRRGERGPRCQRVRWLARCCQDCMPLRR